MSDGETEKRLALLSKLAGAQMIADQITADINSMVRLSQIADDHIPARRALVAENIERLKKVISELD